MSGLDTKRLVLIDLTLADSDAQAAPRHRWGTGYFISEDLVLTAGHVLAEPPAQSIRLWVEDGGAWRGAASEPVWANARLDAALLKADEPIKGLEPVAWRRSRFEENLPFRSAAYPVAAAVSGEEGAERKSSALDGEILALGGGGQGTRELELGVKFAAEAQYWQGISGAPVFVGDELAGLIKSAPRAFRGERVVATPADLLLQEPTFVAAIEPLPDWMKSLPTKTWILVLRSENPSPRLDQTINKAIERNAAAIERAAGQPVELVPVVTDVTDILESPGRWLQFLRVLCAAPVMITDVSGFQPANMMLLGIRAVIRRGVNVTITRDAFDPKRLSELPFNIQETKLIYLAGESDIRHPLHPMNLVGTAIAEGLKQLKTNPTYLDLPVYDLVRCPKPERSAKKVATDEAALVLCSFHDDYQEHWEYLSNEIILQQSDAVRMLDIPSPRLVGQALYESVRWSPYCIVDWTHWRANVFFELGVRLACADVGPISLIEATDATLEAMDPPLEQRRLLIDLFNPIEYVLKEEASEAIKNVLERFHRIIAGQEDPAASALAHNATYRMLVEHFEWQQESVTRTPHEELRIQAESYLGLEPETTGILPALFSANADFNRALRASVRERWIAAWFYLLHSQGEGQTDGEKPADRLIAFRRDASLRKELLSLGENVLRALAGSESQPHIRLRDEIADIIDELESP